ncbi:MAG: aminodeoxychorismate synthase component I [Verrucomicrobiae bacterium]|nr:aminodeoxychorismate synthase component I [Verrucomicrobiae bacterium]
MSSLLSRFRKWAQRRHCVWLDTATGGGKSLLAAEPVRVFRAKGERDTFSRLARELADFSGYAIGYFGYDLKNQLERLPARAVDDLGLPDCWFGFYDEVMVAPAEPATPASASEAPLPAQWTEAASEKAFLAAVEKAKEYIAAGDIYQVNLSRRFECAVNVPSPVLYERLRAANPAPYAAYLDIGEAQILSSSPECFLRMRGREVITRPIKGTRPRQDDPMELLQSPKDQAELLMITDLERNDLGRVCEFGSVHVPELRRVETYATVHHLVATVAGRLREGVSHLDCVRACFPGGSITGAPKIRAMEIIDELEPVARGVYCGAIGYFGPNGESEFNIAIRTVVVKNGRAYFHAGAGIVADSDPAAEHVEVLAKARGMMEALRDVGVS